MNTSSPAGARRMLTSAKGRAKLYQNRVHRAGRLLRSAIKDRCTKDTPWHVAIRLLKLKVMRNGRGRLNLEIYHLAARRDCAHAPADAERPSAPGGCCRNNLGCPRKISLTTSSSRLVAQATQEKLHTRSRELYALFLELSSR